jgi:nucleoside-diphosphate-sugar epimerase
MRVLVVGGQGFIGQALVARLLGGASIDGRRAELITVLDQQIAQRSGDARMRYVEADISERAALERSIDGGVDCVFHLASVPGGAAERDFELGMKVNLHSTLGLLEVLRLAGGAPKLVFASSIGVYGVPMPEVIDEQTIPLPTLSYGAQKLIGEYLVSDYGRRGFVDGRSVRIPGIVARPPSKGMLSLFLSDLIRELSAGRSFVCPVAPEGMSWFMSRPCIVDNLIHAAQLGATQVAAQRSWLLPVLHLSIAAVVEAIARLHGKEVLGRVSYRPDRALQAQFASYPPLLCPTSEAAGFRHDGSVDKLVSRALEPIWESN